LIHILAFGKAALEPLAEFREIVLRASVRAQKYPRFDQIINIPDSDSVSRRTIYICIEIPQSLTFARGDTGGSRPWKRSFGILFQHPHLLSLGVIFIDQVLLPDAHELLQIRLIVLGNTPRIFAGLKLRQGRLIPQQVD
jgi:hypothetical protein